MSSPWPGPVDTGDGCEADPQGASARLVHPRSLGIVAVAAVPAIAGLVVGRAAAPDSSVEATMCGAVAGIWLAAGLVIWLLDGRRSLGFSVAAVGAVAGGILIASAIAVAGDRWRGGDPSPRWAEGVLWIGYSLLICHQLVARKRRVDPFQWRWVGWSLAVGAGAVLLLAILRLALDEPERLVTFALALSALLPLSLVAATAPQVASQIDRVIGHTVTYGGLSVLLVASSVAASVVLGREATRDAARLTLTCIALAGAAALAHHLLRARLSECANRIVYGQRVVPEEPLRTFGQRLTRQMPLDELLQQLVESLRANLALASAEVWIGADGNYQLAAGVPHRSASPLVLGDLEQGVVARAGVSGGTWLEIWLPDLVGPAPPASPAGPIRVASLVHRGELLGLILCRRRLGGAAFNDGDDATLSELARQVAVALNNVRLDSALQESLEQLRSTNDELRTSRSRIVAAGDAERRKLERDLHDGAQQRLVAVAIKLRLAHDAVADGEADAADLIDEARADLQAAIAELRSLAHGIFPPLLMSGGLMDALPAATVGRATLPTEVDVETTERFAIDVEAAVYFCCLEALQNAGKHAGDRATVHVRVWQEHSALRFSVTDDGVGFVPGSTVGGQGFLNMADRLGAFGGSVSIQSRPGDGTTVGGLVPLADQDAGGLS